MQSRFLWCELVVVCLGFMFQFGIPMVVAGVWCFKGGVGCVFRWLVVILVRCFGGWWLLIWVFYWLVFGVSAVAEFQL